MLKSIKNPEGNNSLTQGIKQNENESESYFDYGY